MSSKNRNTIIVLVLVSILLMAAARVGSSNVTIVLKPEGTVEIQCIGDELTSTQINSTTWEVTCRQWLLTR